MKQLLLLLLMASLSGLAWAHEGESHGEAAQAAAAPATKYFSSEALTDKYEVLVKYGELEAGKNAVLQLFLSNAKTNKALDSASVSVKVMGKNLTLAASRTDTGVYQLTGVFPENEIYDLQLSISSALGPDFLQVGRIEIGKKLQAPAPEAHAHWYDQAWVWAILGLLAGIVIMYYLMKNRYRKIAAAAILFTLLVPSAGLYRSAAHEGEAHGGGAANSGGGLSAAFLVEKEAQFLFRILTQPVGGGSFYQSTQLLGTVTAAPQGRAVIQSPQTGKIVALRVNPGQAVTKGQTLAVIEQQVEAGTQIDIIAQRNQLNAEVKAAKAQYERLKSIEDIAARKDVTEARARYEAAVQNLRLFTANVGRNTGSTKMTKLTAPIAGVVGTFNYAIGAVVNTGETLFELTNLSRVYVETQVFAGGPQDSGAAKRYVAFSNADTATYALRPVGTAQAVITENQAQRVVFEVVNPGGKFKIGEHVRVLQYGSNRLAQVMVPTAAITDINGQPAVFIKDKAEQYSVSFIQKGESNPLHTAIVKGVEEGERVVTENIYQMKMIYLNQ